MSTVGPQGPDATGRRGLLRGCSQGQEERGVSRPKLIENGLTIDVKLNKNSWKFDQQLMTNWLTIDNKTI